MVECRRGSCRKCQKRHNTLLHFSQNKPNEQESVPAKVTTALVSFQSQAHSQVVLGTAVIEILDSKGNYRSCRAFLDSCSQCWSNREKLATSLGLKKRSIEIQLKRVRNLESRVKYATSMNIKSGYDNDFELGVNFFVFKEIANAIPINRNAMKIPDEIFLADLKFRKHSNIGVLIGAEYFFDLLLVDKIRVLNQHAVFQETVFGWIFARRFNGRQLLNKHALIQGKIACNIIKYRDLPILWKLREESSEKLRSEEEKIAESLYDKITKRLYSGRYEVELPFNDMLHSLGEKRDYYVDDLQTTWKKLKSALQDEFVPKISSAKLHDMLGKRKINKTESVEEYFLVMKEIAARRKIETDALHSYLPEEAPFGMVAILGR